MRPNAVITDHVVVGDFARQAFDLEIIDPFGDIVPNDCRDGYGLVIIGGYQPAQKGLKDCEGRQLYLMTLAIIKRSSKF